MNLLPQLETVSQQLQEVQSALALVQGGESFRNRAAGLQERIEKREKLVAVFGAFSAGKSSLINALSGEAVLAVSPNPTTATVTRLAYAAPGAEHARIYAKTRDQLFADVRASFAVLQLDVHDLEQAAVLARELKMAGWSPRQRKSVSFLRAFGDGAEQMLPRLGETFEIPLTDISRYTAEERIACFVDRVELRTTRPLFEGGLSLVDTPGVDSIHRRHTDVAFRYMQEADAIVFVLYYTHAFSRADKDFVTQLAGVQEVAGEDKLFVVLNAVDLAASEEEREAVEARVLAELRRCGIAKPRIFSVSSQLGFAAQKLADGSATPEIEAMARQRLGLSDTDTLPQAATLHAESGLEPLAQGLTEFTTSRFETLVTANANRLVAEIEGFAAQQLDSLSKQRAQSDDAKHQLAAAQAALLDTLAKQREAALNDQLEVASPLTADWNELLFHTGERIRIRFGGLLRETFNPGRFRNEQKAKESWLDACAELAALLERQIELETRTLWLRMKKSAGQALNGLEQECRSAMQQVSAPVPAAPWQLSESDEPMWQAAISADILTSAFRFFKSSKQFFEGTGQSEFQAHVEAPLLAAVRAELERIHGEQNSAVLQNLAEATATGIAEAKSLVASAQSTSTISDEAFEQLQDGWAHVVHSARRR